MGLRGKFGVILKTLGQPIVRHTTGGGQFFTQTFLEEDQDEDGLPVADTEERDQPEGWEWGEPREADLFDTINEGWHFNGLNQGLHMEIWFDEGESELKVIYKSYVVYKEQAGELQSFVPFKEWQEAIEVLYSQAHKIFKNKQTLSNQAKSKKEKAAKLNWVDKMKKLWGV
jgi:hypothetical protein